MKAYPVLTEMGVESPKQIDKYYITSINRIDVLRIVYARPDESILPSSRSYKFPRIQVEKTEDGESKPVPPRMHPKLKDAIKELDIILEAKTSKQDIVAEILGEIELLEEDIALRSECLKVLVGKIPEVECK